MKLYFCLLLFGLHMSLVDSSASIYRRFLDSPPNVGNICPQVKTCPCFMRYESPCMICPCLQNQGSQDSKSPESKPDTSSSGPCMKYFNAQCPLKNYRDNRGCIVCKNPETTTTTSTTTPTTTTTTTSQSTTRSSTTEFITITPPTTPTQLYTSTLPTSTTPVTTTTDKTSPTPRITTNTKPPTSTTTTVASTLSTLTLPITSTVPLTTRYITSSTRPFSTTSLPKTTQTDSTTSTTKTTLPTTTFDVSTSSTTISSTTTSPPTTLDEFGCPSFDEHCPDTPECLHYNGDCPVCTCEIAAGPVTCPSVTCLLDCGQFPLKTDQNGCTICECNIGR